MKRALSIVVIVLLCGETRAAELSEREKIELLLGAVADADLVFIRNGSEHSPEKAAHHLRSKWKRAGDRIRTAREFVERIASGSSTSGKAYSVRLPDGTERATQDWLLEALGRIEAEPAATPRPEPSSVASVLEALRSSGLEFLRVESDEIEVYTGREMARHIELKYLLDKSPELPAAEFVSRYCSRSVLHGTDYLVRLEDGSESKLGDWLGEQLRVVETGGDR